MVAFISPLKRRGFPQLHPKTKENKYRIKAIEIEIQTLYMEIRNVIKHRIFVDADTIIKLFIEGYLMHVIKSLVNELEYALNISREEIEDIVNHVLFLAENAVSRNSIIRYFWNIGSTPLTSEVLPLY